MSPPDLPKNWKQAKQGYYYNTVTDQTATDLANLPAPLQKGWKEAVDKKSGARYYWNTKTKETRQTPPFADAPPAPLAELRFGRNLFERFKKIT